ncbi:phospholipase B [Schizopora paradoxa]|uniref:Lysophospholipase n=1 Tax=Schizopora paradoxa TaxID=27342 RepID=A0A0H2RKV4_9AGAM|nr:phospholipase B [Schizopora paradoxa]
MLPGKGVRLPFSLLSLVLNFVSSDALGLGTPLDYAPNVNVTCPPNDTLIRVFTPQTQSLNELEANYTNTRLNEVIPQAWQDWLGNGSAIGYNLSSFGGNYSKIGIAISGGGYRAAQYGAGVLSGFDARNSSAVAAGTGGMLQVTSYISALSGGSWLTGSLFFNDWPTIPDMIFGNNGNLSGWILDLNLAAPDGLDVFNDENQYFFGSILYSIVAKANLSIYTSITDPWARMISYHFLNETTRQNFFLNDSAHGAGQLWSDIPQIPSVQQHLTPWPLVVANSRPVGSNSTAALTPEPIVYEITPAEFGSWDPNLSAMANMTYVGTHINNGAPPNATGCVTGFDQAGFMMGTSASLFNQILDFADNTLEGFDSSDAKNLIYVLQRQLREVRTRAADVANWPNPFQSIKPDTFEDSSSNWLELIDGSSNLENVPFGALFVKARELDVIIGVDSSADDSSSFPNGTSPLFSQARIATLLNSSHQTFPPIPSSFDEFVSTGVNQRPTFFGCDPTQNPPEFPLVIYMPNAPPLNGDNPVTNTDTFKIQYTAKHSLIFLDQVHNNTIGGFVPNQLGPDPNWGKCLQCAAIDRARLKVTPTIGRSDICTTCFKQYCFNPQNPPNASEIVGRKYTFVDPDPQGVSKVEGFLGNNKAPFIVGLVLLFLLIIAAVFFLRRWKAKKDREYKRLTMEADDAGAPWLAYHERLSTLELPSREGLGK